MADLEPFLHQNGANSVSPARYLTNHLTFHSDTLHIYLLPVSCVQPSAGKLEFKIPDLEHL